MPPPSAVPSGIVALAQDLPWGSSSSRAPRKLLLCGETQGTAQTGQEAAGSLGPVSPGNKQSPQHPLSAQKARLESPLGEDARLCGPRVSGLLVFFWRLYLTVLKISFFFFFYKLHHSISSNKENKEFVHMLDQALVPFRKLFISSNCSVPQMRILTSRI